MRHRGDPETAIEGLQGGRNEAGSKSQYVFLQASVGGLHIRGVASATVSKPQPLRSVELPPSQRVLIP